MEIENLIRYPALAVGLMEIENLIRYTARAVGLKPPAMRGEARLRGLYRTSRRAKAPGYARIISSKITTLTPASGIDHRRHAGYTCSIWARHAVPLLAPPGAPMNADHASIATGGNVNQSTAIPKAFGEDLLPILARHHRPGSIRAE